MKPVIALWTIAFTCGVQPSLFAAPDVSTVVVFPFENRADRSLDWIGEALSELVSDGMSGEPSLYVFSREERLAEYDKLGIPEGAVLSRATALRIAWSLGADTLVTGSYSLDGDRFEVQSTAIDLAQSRALEPFRIEGSLKEVVSLSAAIAASHLSRIAPAAPSRDSIPAAVRPLSPNALESYIRGLLNLDPAVRTKMLQEALRLQPQYYAAAFQLGRTLYLEKDYKASSQALDKVARTSPHWAHARFLAGLDYYHDGEFSKAAAAFGAIPRTYDTLINLGCSQLNHGDILDALQTWRRAIEVEPLAGEAFFNIAYVSMLRADWDNAIRNLDQFLKLAGRDGEALFLLARAQDRTGRTDESQRTLAQAIRLTPRVERWRDQPLPQRLERLRAQPNIAALRLGSQSATGAESLWNAQRLTRWSRTQDLEARLEAVQNLMESQLYGEAVTELRSIIVGYPRSSDGHLFLGQVYERQKNLDLAIAEFERSLAIRESPEAYIALARAHRAVNQPRAAVTALDNALRLDPGHTAAASMKAEIEKSFPAERKPRL